MALADHRLWSRLAPGDGVPLVIGMPHVVAERGWHFVPLTMAGCLSLFVRLWHSARPAGEWDAWRDATLVRIRALNPTVVVMSNYRWHELLDAGSETPPPETRA